MSETVFMTLIRSWPLLSALFLALPGWGQEPLDESRKDGLLSPLAEDLLLEASQTTAEGLLARISSLDVDDRLGDAERERVLRDVALGLRQRPPDPAIRPVLAFLADYPSRALVPHPESRGVPIMPRFDVAAAARGTIHHWDWIDAVQRAGRYVEDDRLEDLIADLAAADGASRGGLLSAVHQGDPRVLSRWGPRLTGGPWPDRAATPLAKAVGERLADPELLRWVVNNGASPWRQQTLRDLDRWLTATQAASIWAGCIETCPPAEAGIAVVRLSTSPARPPDWAHRLVTWLGHEDRGAAAALALSRLPADESVPVLAIALEKASGDARHDGDALHLRRLRLVIETSPHDPVRALGAGARTVERPR